MSDAASRPVNADQHFEIEQFLFREAALLDRRMLAEWFDLLCRDISYRVAARVIREANASSQDYFIIDEGSDALRRRIDQISNPKLTYAENPPTFTRRFVSNVQAAEMSGGLAYKVTSNFILYRHRLETPDGDFYVGERHDVLQRTDGGLRIRERFARLDQAIFSGSVSVIF
jgi:3-phenylpropionate/cinnamic acid dioxygenase small subunit